MKILITSFTYLPNKDGVSHAVATMAEGLRHLGWHVEVATGLIREGESDPPGGIQVHRFDLHNTPALDAVDSAEGQRFQQWVIAWDPDVLINHCWDAWPAVFSHPLFACLRARKVMISHGFTQHIWQPHPRPFFGLGHWMRGLFWTLSRFPTVLRSYDVVVFLSERKSFFDRFLDHKLAICLGHPRIYVLPNSVDVTEWEGGRGNFRAKYGIGEGFFVLCVANFCSRKNQIGAVKAFRKANIPGSTLVLIGSEFNAYSDRVRRYDEVFCRQYPEGRVVLLEGVGRKDTVDAFKACDVVLLTARAETQPIVLIEAMACGRPWVSTPTGCVREMEGGLIACSTNPLASLLKSLSSDMVLREELGRQGRAAVSCRYEKNRCLQKLQEAINSAFQ